MAAKNPGGKPMKNIGDRKVTKEQLKRISLSLPEGNMGSLIKKLNIPPEESTKILKKHLDVFLLGYLMVWYKNQGACRSALEQALRDSGAPEDIVNKLHTETSDETLSHEQLKRVFKDFTEEKIEPLLLKLEFTPDQERQVLMKYSNRMILLEIITIWWESPDASRSLLENAIRTALLNSDAEDPILNILRTECGGYTTEGQLQKIAKDFPPAKYLQCSLALGYKRNYASAVLVRHLQDIQGAILEILMAWKNKTKGPCENLEAALIISEAYDLVEIIYKPS